MKIFKKLLPVIIGLSLVILIGITIVIVNVANGRTPKVTNGDETYLHFGNLNVTKQDLYDALKKDYGVSELVRLVDLYLYKDEYNKVDVNSQEFIDFVEEDIYGEDFKGDKQKAWEDILDSLALTGVISSSLAKSGAKYDDYTGEVWTKVKEYYRLQYAKDVWAKAKHLENLKNGKEQIEFTDDEIEDYFEDNFGKETTGLYIPFTNNKAAIETLKAYGINVENAATSSSSQSSSSFQLAGWVKTSWDTDTKKYPTLEDYLMPDEVIAKFIQIYNDMWRYTNDGKDIITSEDYTTTPSAKKTLQVVKLALDEKMRGVRTTTVDIILPKEVEILNSDLGKATITWDAITDDETFLLDPETGKLDITTGDSNHTKTLTATLSLGEDNEIKVSYDIQVLRTSSIDPDDSTDDKVLTIDPVNTILDYTFNLNNDMNKFNKFIYEANDSSTFGSYLSASNTTYTFASDVEEFYKSYSIKPRSVGNFYCLFIKLDETEEPSLSDEETHQKVVDKMIEEKSELDDNERERLLYVNRQENKFKIYDSFIEAIYEYNYNTFYSSTLGESDYPKFKKSTKNKSKIVASVGDLKITPDELYEQLSTKYGSTYFKSFLDEYYIINDESNVYLNPWKDIKDKSYVKSLIKSDIASFKQNFELDYFTYAYLSYYGFIPNFPSSYGWKKFIHDYFNADSDEDLLISKLFGGKIYSDALEAYTKRLYKDNKYELLQAEMEDLLDKFYQVEVMNLIISVDYDYDGSPDSKIVESNKEDIVEENWTEEQMALVEELANLIMSRYDEVIAVGTLATKLTEIVNVYNNAPYKNVENPTTLEEAFGKYKLAGLQLKFEAATSYNDSSSLVDEFKDAMVDLWQYAKENELLYDAEKASDDDTYTNPIVEPLKYNVIDGKYAFASSYGYHVVAITSASTATAFPTNEEMDLYEAVQELTEVSSSLESAKTNLENASGNETAVSSYKEQIKILEKEVEDAKKAVKDALAKLKATGEYEDLEEFDDESNSYTIDEKINARCSAWFDKALSAVEEHILEKEIIRRIKEDYNQMEFADYFNEDQFNFYLDYLLKSYDEEEA